MALSEAQRRELERLGVENVNLKLAYAGVGRGANVVGFITSDMNRGDVEDWLAAETKKATKLQTDTLWWAKASAYIALVGLIISVALGIIDHFFK